MRQGSWRAAWLMAAIALLCVLVSFPSLAGAPCGCGKVEVSGAGYSEINGTYKYRAGIRFTGVSDMFRVWIGPNSNLMPNFPLQWAFIDTASGYWVFALVMGDGPVGNPQPCTHDCVIFLVSGADYRNSARPFCPPETGWSGGTSPTPTLSLDLCIPPVPIALTVIPTGDAGPGEFLDVVRSPVNGDDPPMIGTLPLEAIHPVGDIVTGSCVIQRSTGASLLSTYVHLYVYSVDASGTPEVLDLVEHWTVTYNSAGGDYEFAWDTSGLGAGYYNLRLSFEDGTAEDFRIELVAP